MAMSTFEVVNKEKSKKSNPGGSSKELELEA